MNLSRSISSLLLGGVVLAASIAIPPRAVLSQMPLHPDVLAELESQGRLAETRALQQDAIGRGVGVFPHSIAPVRNRGIGAGAQALNCLVILVDFDDNPASGDSIDASTQDFEDLLFSMNTYPTGSMKDYYEESSLNQATINGQVAGWYRMPENYAYYVAGNTGFGNYPNNAQRLAEDAVAAADGDVDFSLYDNDNDGWVDSLFIVHAGPGFEDTGNVNYIWSHAWGFGAQSRDGINLSGYTMEPEESGSGGLVHIGVFCHEYGHALGLPDLYNGLGGANGIGFWCVMASGTWANGGLTPVHFSAWCKETLGWVVPNAPQQDTEGVTLRPAEEFQDMTRLSRLGNGNQYFLVENRLRRGFDTFLPGEGVLIWHINPNGTGAADPRVMLEQADGDFDLEAGFGSDAGDPWPGVGGSNNPNRNFFRDSSPGSRTTTGGDTLVAVRDITRVGDSYVMDIEVGTGPPPLQVTLSLNGSPNLGNAITLVTTGPSGRPFAVISDRETGNFCYQSVVCFDLEFSNRMRVLHNSVSGDDDLMPASNEHSLTLQLPSKTRFSFQTFYVQSVIKEGVGLAGFTVSNRLPITIFP